MLAVKALVAISVAKEELKLDVAVCNSAVVTNVSSNDELNVS